MKGNLGTGREKSTGCRDSGSNTGNDVWHRESGGVGMSTGEGEGKWREGEVRPGDGGGKKF